MTFDRAFKAVVFLSLVLMSCTTTAQLYPVKGPLSERNPVPVLTAKVDGIWGNTGNINLTLPDGEECHGRWSSAAGVAVNFGMVNLRSQYQYLSGSGLSVGNVPGVNRGEAVAVGNRGTIIEIEFYTGSGTASGYGIAADNKGNIYRIIF
jgi:hypothetical protein